MWQFISQIYKKFMVGISHTLNSTLLFMFQNIYQNKLVNKYKIYETGTN